MGAAKQAGVTCTNKMSCWTANLNDGTLCRQPSPQPRFVCASDAVVQPQRRVVVPPVESGLFNELLIIKGSEWFRFAAYLGANSIAPIEAVLQDLRPALQKLGPLGRAAIRRIGDQDYVVISGYSGLRKILTGTKYLPENVKVADLVIGSERLANSAVKGTALSVVLVSADDVIEAFLDDKPLLSGELGFTVLADAGKQVVASIAGYIVAAGLAMAGAPVVIPIAAGIAVGIAVSYALDGAAPTPQIVKAMNDYYDSLIDRGGRWMFQLEREILRQVWPATAPYPY